ncbi:MAG TPA: long-chain fatty acid--CoA ligase, partial [Blastocatellia bacterium]|nr:long-chain fatty acid--CoA ligase [Blastocatellia bacterium]
RAISKPKPNLLNCKRFGSWQSFSTAEVAEKVRATTLGLYSLGVRPQAHVGLLSENRPEWTIADFGVLNCAAADVPIYATQAPKQVAYILNDSGVEVMFISTPAQYERIKECLAEVPRLKYIIAFDKITADDPRLLSFDELQQRGKALGESQLELYEQLRSQVNPEDLATLIYTSGTTGEPKGVMLTHRNIVSNVLASNKTFAVEESDVVLSFLPLSHIFERSALYLYLYNSTAVYYAESVNAVAENMREVRPHFMTSVPRIFEKIYAKTLEKAEEGGAIKKAIVNWAVEVAKQWATVEDSGRNPGFLLNLKRKIALKLVFSKWQAAMGSRIKDLISGGAPLSLEIAQVFYGAGLPILQGYGLTESSPVITANKPNANRLGSVGRPIHGVEVKIAEDGEILASGPNIMRGYYNKPEATAETLKLGTDGKIWLHTGDVGHLDSDGYLFITDRKKDLIKTSGGKYIAPQPIENAIKQSRFVNQVVVIGEHRKFPAALIVPKMDALKSYAALKNISYKDEKELLRDPKIIDLIERQVDKFTPDLGHFEKIKGVILLERELTIEGGELTPTLKVKRRVVCDKYKEQIDQLYAEKEEQFSGKH